MRAVDLIGNFLVGGFAGLQFGITLGRPALWSEGLGNKQSRLTFLTLVLGNNNVGHDRDSSEKARRGPI